MLCRYFFVSTFTFVRAFNSAHMFPFWTFFGLFPFYVRWSFGKIVATAGRKRIFQLCVIGFKGDHTNQIGQPLNGRRSHHNVMMAMKVKCSALRSISISFYRQHTTIASGWRPSLNKYRFLWTFCVNCNGFRAFNYSNAFRLNVYTSLWRQKRTYDCMCGVFTCTFV